MFHSFVSSLVVALCTFACAASQHSSFLSTLTIFNLFAASIFAAKSPLNIVGGAVNISSLLGVKYSADSHLAHKYHCCWNVCSLLENTFWVRLCWCFVCEAIRPHYSWDPLSLSNKSLDPISLNSVKVISITLHRHDCDQLNEISRITKQHCTLLREQKLKRRGLKQQQSCGFPVL